MCKYAPLRPANIFNYSFGWRILCVLIAVIFIICFPKIFLPIKKEAVLYASQCDCVWPQISPLRSCLHCSFFFLIFTLKASATSVTAQPQSAVLIKPYKLHPCAIASLLWGNHICLLCCRAVGLKRATDKIKKTNLCLLLCCQNMLSKMYNAGKWE